MCRELKDSGIPWIGEIPEGWNIDRLQVALQEIVEKNSPIKTDYILSLTNNRGVIPYTDKGDVGNKSKDNLEEYKVAYPNTIVANSMNILIGSVGICDYYGCVSPVYYVFQATEKGSLRFFNYIMSSEPFQKHLRQYANGILEIRLRLSSSNILKRYVPFPSLAEQQRIADFLDRKCAEVDEMIALQEQIIEELKAYKQSVVTEAVTKGLNPAAPMRDSGNKWIGLIPKTWGVERIKTIFSERSELSEDGSETLLSVSEYYGVANRAEKVEDGEYVSRAESLVGYKKCYKGDLVSNIMLAWKGSMGVTELDGIVSPAYCVYKPSKSVYPRYYHYLFRIPLYTSIFRLYSKGIIDSRLRLYSPYFFDIKAIIPSYAEQRRIAEFLDRKCADIDRLIQTKQSKIDSLKEYKKSIIYEYVTGKREVTE